MTESLETALSVSSVKAQILSQRKSDVEVVMNISQVESPAITAEETTWLELKMYKGIVFLNKSKVSFSEFSPISVIIDKLKLFFGLEGFNRKLVMFPSQQKYTLECHWGYERFINAEEINNYEVFKIRLFRWIVGLPHSRPKSDIIVRYYKGKNLTFHIKILN